VPEDYKTIIDKCWQLRRAKRFTEAELLLQENLENFTAGSFAHRVLKANLADVLLQQGDKKAAHETALQVLAEDPDQAIALTVIGLIELDQKQYSEAIENLKKAFELVPGGYRAGRLARAYELTGDLEKALSVLNEALKHNPRDGFLLRQHNKLKQKAAVKMPLEGDQGQSEPPAVNIPEEKDHFPYAEQMRARLQGLEPSEAAAQLQKAIKVGERKLNPYLYLLLGDLHREAGYEEEAVKAYRQAYELDTQNTQALSQYLFALRRSGRKKEAWPLLKELLDRRPDDVTAKSSLLKDAGELNKEKEAAAFFEELLEKYPDRKELFGAIRKMQKAIEHKEGQE